MTTLLLGLGNLLMRDDAFGVHAANRLRQNFALPPGLAIIDGGTLGLDLLPRLEGVRRLLIIDAIDMGAPAGSLRRLTGAEIPQMLAGKLSVHQMGVQDLLAAAEWQGNLPAEIVVWGVQPAALTIGLELSSTVAAALPDVERAILAELAAWGIRLERRGGA